MTSLASADQQPAIAGPGSGRRGQGVFADNRHRPIHRWYPFVEGYSSELVERFLRPLPLSNFVFDPFGGSGTTLLAASALGFTSGYTEVNPYLAWVAEVKVNQSREAAVDPDLDRLLELADEVEGNETTGSPDHPLVKTDAARGFFPEGVASRVVGILDWLQDQTGGPLLHVARLAVATALIPCSNMVRRTDLRRRRGDDPAPLHINSEVALRLRQFHADLVSAGLPVRPATTFVASDTTSKWRLDRGVDVYVTSPPYLNGTNYCRNTKLELLALGFIKEESELADLRASAISAGINSVSRRHASRESLASVHRLVDELADVAYDARIPAMVQAYFGDMQIAIRRMRENANDDALLVLDIGDSRYCGVHVPTDRLLIEIARCEGWTFTGEETLRVRKSYDGTSLSQVLLQFRAA